MERVIVGVIGAGTMGAGIAQLALENGHDVVLHDVDEAAIDRGRARVAEGLARRAARLDLDSDSADDWVAGRLAALRDAHSLDAVAAEAELVLEAAVEDLSLKQTVFEALDAAAPPDVILATNTSALSVAAIAARTRRPARVIGLHFFNPAPVMPLVEVVVPAAASVTIVERVIALMEGWGKTPVRCADTPGFIVNRVNRPFTIEALRILESGLATVYEIDAAIRAAGFPMGPFELMDFVGLDVNLAAAVASGTALADPTGFGHRRSSESSSPRATLGGRPGLASTAITRQRPHRARTWAARHRHRARARSMMLPSSSAFLERSTSRRSWPLRTVSLPPSISTLRCAWAPDIRSVRADHRLDRQR